MKKKINKKLLARIGSVLACVLLVGALAVPAFADRMGMVDYNSTTGGTWYPPLGTINVSPISLVGGGTFDPSGCYQYVFKSVVEPDQNTITMWQGSAGDICVVLPNGMAYTPTIFQFKFINNRWMVSLTVGAEVVVHDCPTSNSSPMVVYMREYPPEYVPPEHNYYWLSCGQFMEVYYVDDAVIPSGDSSSFFDVCSFIMTWIVTALGSVQSLFFANGSLTFFGVLSVVSVSIGLAFLVFLVVKRFLVLRG